MFLRRITGIAGLLVCVSWVWGTQSIAADKIVTPIAESFQSGLVGVMKEAETLGVKGRYDALLPLVQGTFNLTLMAATASSPYWRASNKEGRTAFVKSFTGLSVSTLATLFDGYNGEKFKVVNERVFGKWIRIADSEITKSDGGIVKISFVGANVRGRWSIIDIIVDGGISEIKKRRNEFVSLLKEGGLPRLTRELNSQTAALLSGKKAK